MTASVSTGSTGRPATLVQPSDSSLKLCSRGSETQRGGIKTTASGRITSSAAKKAIGEWIEPQVAGLKKGVQGEGKNGKGGTPKQQSEKDKEMKELQKDIKAFLVLKMFVCVLDC